MMERVLRPELGFKRYVIVVSFVSIFPAIALGWLSELLATKAAFSSSAAAPMRAGEDLTPLAICFAVFVAPIVESTLVVFVTSIAQSMVPNRSISFYGLIVALLAGFCHAFVAPLWFLVPLWSFFIFTCSWLRWRKCELPNAFGVLLVPHIVQNMLVYSVCFL